MVSKTNGRIWKLEVQVEELLKKIDLQDKQIKKLFFITSRNSAELENMRQKKGS